MVIMLADDVIIRKEDFGAILFHKKNGTMIEIDREAYGFVRYIESEQIIDTSEWEPKAAGEELHLFIQHMMNEEFFIRLPAGILNKKSSTYCLSAPETVHLAVTFRCGNKCRDCYIERHKDQIKREMNTKELLMVIDKISDFGVFQIAVGGGEPLIRDDIEEILSYANDKDLTIHLTSGRHDISEELLSILGRYLTVLQIGIRNEELLQTQGRDIEKLCRIADFMKKTKTALGANVIVDTYGIKHFASIIETLEMIGFQTITLLRYKPSVDKESFKRFCPSDDQMMKFKQLLTESVQMHPNISYRIDCSFAFLEKNLGEDMAEYRGIRGCVAGSRIISVAPDGSVYPCSQLVRNDCNAGNLLTDSLKEIWGKSKVLINHRTYKSSETFTNSICGRCEAKGYCGGCQIFGEDIGGVTQYCMEG